MSLQEVNDTKKLVESEVIKELREKGYTLNAVNDYGENLLHVTAANGCLKIIKEILLNKDTRHVINNKNKLGWTPLMLAISNKDINMVKVLLENNANPRESTYLGMPVIGLATAVGKDMFENIHEICPSAIINAANDDISPLCIAAMKNDKELFFKLMNYGLDIYKANKYTQIMMKQSTVPEIANLLETHLDIEDYWNDTSDNISIESDVDEDITICSTELVLETKERYTTDIVQDVNDEYDSQNDKNVISLKPTAIFKSTISKTSNTVNNLKKNSETCTKNLLAEFSQNSQENVITPKLTCIIADAFPTSPNIYDVQESYDHKYKKNENEDCGCEHSSKNEMIEHSLKPNNNSFTESQPILQRLQYIRPRNLDIQTNEMGRNNALKYTPEFSPARSPHVPLNTSDENVFDENTPTPPRYKTPPRGMIHYSEEVQMINLLKHYGLIQHVPIFIEQEVDIDLFVTLNDNDLIEIGIQNKSDREALLDMIEDYKKRVYSDIIE